MRQPDLTNIRLKNRNTPGGMAVLRAFPDGKLTTITSTRLTDEPDEVDALATRFESFGDSNPLFPIATRLREKAAERPGRAALSRLGEGGRIDPEDEESPPEEPKTDLKRRRP